MRLRSPDPYLGDEAKVTIGKTTYDLDRDLLASKVRIGTNSSQVSSKGSGMRFLNGASGNVNQALIEETTGFNAAQPGKNSDGSNMAPGEIAVAALGGAVVTGVFASEANRKLKNPIGKASGYVGNKIKGNIGGSDANGKTIYSDKEQWEELKKDGFATKDSDGKWSTSLSKEQVQKHFNQKSFSADITPDTKIQSTTTISPTTPPNANASKNDISSPSDLDTDSIPQNAEKPHPVQMEKKFFGSKPVKTVADAQARMKTIGNMSSIDVGKKDMLAQIDSKRAGSTPEQNIALNKMENAMASGKNITPKMIKAAGFEDGSFIMKQAESFEFTDKKTGEIKTQINGDKLDKNR